jgi:metal-responsive CopG/Arc/MetJ family transcriptional regulator
VSNNNGRFVTVILTDEEMQAIDALQKRLKVRHKRSDIIRQAVRRYTTEEMAKPLPESLQTAIPIEA